MRLTNVLVIAGHLLLPAGVAAQLFPDPRPPYSYLGCYDGTDAGLTTNLITPNNAGGGDPVKCQADCNILASPYLYMRDNECICQNPDQDQAPPGPPLSDDLCNRPCSQNASAPCGGEFEYTLYGGRDPNTPPPSATLSPDPRPPYTYFGCYPGDAFTGQVTVKPDIGGDPVACQAACDAQGSSFAGMFNRNNCFCQTFGSATGPEGLPVDDSFCNAPCFRNASAPCGDTAGQYVTLYAGREPSPPPVPTTSLVPKPQPPYRYIGCYQEGLNIVDDFTRVEGPEGDPAACQTACANLGSTYVLMYFIDCQCSNPGGSTVFPFRRPVADGFCNEACFDDATAACGGTDGQRVWYTVYSNRTEDPIVSTTVTETETATPAPTTGILSPDPRPPFSYLGCWDLLDLKLFNYEIGESTGSPVVCQSYCNDRRAVYVAMIGDSCHCQPDASEANRPVGSPAADGSCNIPCSGNVTAACGGIEFVEENGEFVRQIYYATLYGLRNETETSSSSTLVLSTSSTFSSATGSGTLFGSSTSTGPVAGTSTSGTVSTPPDSGSQTSSSTGTSMAGASSTGSASSAPGGGGTTSSTSTSPVFPESLLPSPSFPSTSSSSGPSNSPDTSLPSPSPTSGAGSSSSGSSLPGSPTGPASQRDSATSSTARTGTGTGTAATTESSTGGPFVSTSTFFLVGTPVIFSIFPAGQAPTQTGTS